MIGMEDYLIEIGNAKKEYLRRRLAFEDVLDKWEDENEDLGEFVLGLNYKDKKEVYIRFEGDFENDKVDMDIVNRVCDEFNLNVHNKLIDVNYVSSHITTRFILRHKEKPYGL